MNEYDYGEECVVLYTFVIVTHGMTATTLFLRVTISYVLALL